MTTSHYWVYILHCQNDSYYTGYTTDLMRRYQAHLDGKCKYTRSFKPLAIAQAWKISGTKGSAMRIENFIKKLSREGKEQLLLKPESLLEFFQGLELCVMPANAGIQAF
ncbi:MAG: GIY-YIG nuclease family protein [Pseudomonadota bacterium]